MAVRCADDMATTRLLVALLLMLRAAYSLHFPLPGDGTWWSREGAAAAGDDGDAQVVYLPALLPRESTLAADSAEAPLPYSFDAFGRSFDLKLIPNRQLVSRGFRVWSENGPEPKLSGADSSCHFQNSGTSAVAALSACRDHALHGLIVVDNSTYEVHPLQGGLGRAADGDRMAHVIRRAAVPAAPRDDERVLRRRPRLLRHGKPASRQRPSHYTIELALFLDAAAYKIFSPLFNYNDAELRDMLLAYINGVQALYQHKSLGTRIQLSLVRMTLLRSQPPNFSAEAENNRVLDGFCHYQKSLNIEDDDDPDHWDMALLLTGLDIFAYDRHGKRSTVTMGLAPVGGVCLPTHACVVAEFGVTDDLERPYPSAGFTSVYILAHEIGHNLGMHHDGTGNNCATNGFIMSSTRGVKGEVTWSPCSAAIVADLSWTTCLTDGSDDVESAATVELHHDKYGATPGVIWTAKRQCEVVLRDTDAAPLDARAPAAARICDQLVCRSPHRVGFYYAGPALPGTACGHGMWCHGGECVPSTLPDDHPTTTPPMTSPSVATAVTSQPAVTTVASSGWSPWRDGTCRSGCTFKSKGFKERSRTCVNADTCEGPAYDAVLCDDVKVCGKKTRVSVTTLASRKCAAFARRLHTLDPRGEGLQAPHDPMQMWMGCAIFCRRASSSGYYAPRAELNDAGLDPYLPDGTWCHHDGRTDYYCLQHHCLPEDFKMSAQLNVWDLRGRDVDGAMGPRPQTRPKGAYHSLGATVPTPRLPDYSRHFLNRRFADSMHHTDQLDIMERAEDRWRSTDYPSFLNLEAEGRDNSGIAV